MHLIFEPLAATPNSPKIHSLPISRNSQKPPPNKDCYYRNNLIRRMGNCLKISMKRRDEDESMEHYQEDWKEASDGEPSVKESGGLKVKIVLTREELEWLMLQLQVNEKKNKLEELLREIERGREKVKTTWKPSLESIKESHEAVEMER